MFVKALTLAAFAAAALQTAGAQPPPSLPEGYDSNAPVKLTGTVARVDWGSPNVIIHFDVIEDGRLVQWVIRGGTPNTMIRNGLTRDSIRPGLKLTIRGYQSTGRICDPVCKAVGRDITFTEGRKLVTGSGGTGAPRDGSD